MVAIAKLTRAMKKRVQEEVELWGRQTHFYWKDGMKKEKVVKISDKGKGHLCRKRKCKVCLKNSKEDKVALEE